MATQALGADAGATPGGIVGAVGFLIVTATGLVVAATSMVKAIRPAKPPDDAPATAETDDQAHARILRETVEVMANALEEAATARDELVIEQQNSRHLAAELAEERKESRMWRDRYVRLVEERRP